MNVTQQMQARYATKVYDANKKIPAELFAEIENVLHLSPTSMNLQPLRFVIAESEDGKARVAKSAVGIFGFNAEKIMASSHAVVIASKISVDSDYLEMLLEQEFQDGRYANEDEKVARGKARLGFVELHRHQFNDEAEWHAKQAYIALGSVLTAATQLGIDSTAIEGVDMNILDQEFAFGEQGYHAQFVVIFGYRDDNDFNAKLPKSRLPKTTLMEKV